MYIFMKHNYLFVKIHITINANNLENNARYEITVLSKHTINILYLKVIYVLLVILHNNV